MHGRSSPSSWMLDGRADLTGTSENTDYLGTIQSALRIIPRAREIVAVVDATTTGQANRDAMSKIEASEAVGVSFRYLSLADFTPGGLCDTLAALPKDSVVLLLQHFVDRDGVSHDVTESTRVLAARSAVPLFVVSDTRMGLGALGGHVVSGYHHGKTAEEMLRVKRVPPTADP